MTNLWTQVTNKSILILASNNTLIDRLSQQSSRYTRVIAIAFILRIISKPFGLDVGSRIFRGLADFWIFFDFLGTRETRGSEAKEIRKFHGPGDSDDSDG